MIFLHRNSDGFLPGIKDKKIKDKKFQKAKEMCTVLTAFLVAFHWRSKTRRERALNGKKIFVLLIMLLLFNGKKFYFQDSEYVVIGVTK